MKQNESYCNDENESYCSDEYFENFSLALKVVNDCDCLPKSYAVLDSVIKTLSLNVSYDDL